MYFAFCIYFYYHTRKPRHLQGKLACSQFGGQLFTIYSPELPFLRYNGENDNECKNGGISMAVSVLIVEDDRNIAELLQMYLEKEGYAVTIADDGGKGLAKYRAIKPDLVLLDVMMPVMTAGPCAGHSSGTASASPRIKPP